MSKKLHITGIDEEFRTKAKILAAGRHITLAQFIEDLIELAWRADTIEPNGKIKRKIRRILKGYEGKL